MKFKLILHKISLHVAIENKNLDAVNLLLLNQKIDVNIQEILIYKYKLH